MYIVPDTESNTAVLYNFIMQNGYAISGVYAMGPKKYITWLNNIFLPYNGGGTYYNYYKNDSKVIRVFFLTEEDFLIFKLKQL